MRLPRSGRWRGELGRVNADIRILVLRYILEFEWKEDIGRAMDVIYGEVSRAVGRNLLAQVDLKVHRETQVIMAHLLTVLLLYAVCADPTPISLTITEGEEWSHSLDSFATDQTHRLHVHMNHSSFWVNDPFSLNLHQTHLYPSAACPSLLIYFSEMTKEVLLTCHSNVLQAIQVNTWRVLWEIEIGGKDSHIRKLQKYDAPSGFYVYCLVEGKNRVYMYRVHAAPIEMTPGAPELVDLEVLETREMVDFVIMPEIVNRHAMVIQTDGDLFIYELDESTPPLLRYTKPTPSLRIDRVLSWTSILFLQTQNSSLFSYSIFNFNLTLIHSYDLSAYGDIIDIHFPHHKLKTLTVPTTQGVLLISTESDRVERWFPGEVTAAVVMDKWLLRIKDRNTSFEVYNLHWNRTEGSWDVNSTSFRVLSFDFHKHRYELAFLSSASLQVYSLLLGSRTLHGISDAPGLYSGYIAGAETVNLVVDVMSIGNNSILCGTGYNLSRHMSIQLPVQNASMALDIDHLFSGPAIEIDITSPNHREQLHRINLDSAVLMQDLSSDFVLEAVLYNLVVYRSERQVGVYAVNGYLLTRLKLLTIPGIKSIRLYGDCIFVLCTVDAGSGIRKYSAYSELEATVPVSDTCKDMSVDGFGVLCVSPDLIQIYSLDLVLVWTITSHTISATNVSFVGIGFAIETNNEIDMVVACERNGIYVITQSSGEVRKVLEPVRGLKALEICQNDMLVLADIDGKIAIYSIKDQQVTPFRTLPVWETGPYDHLSIHNSLLFLRKQDYLYLYSVLDTVHNSLIAVLPVHLHCTYLFSTDLIREYCPETLIFRTYTVFHKYIPYQPFKEIPGNIANTTVSITIKAENLYNQTAETEFRLGFNQN